MKTTPMQFLPTRGVKAVPDKRCISGFYDLELVIICMQKLGLQFVPWSQRLSLLLFFNLSFVIVFFLLIYLLLAEKPRRKRKKWSCQIHAKLYWSFIPEKSRSISKLIICSLQIILILVNSHFVDLL